MIIVKIGGGGGINIGGIVRDLAGLTERYIVVHGANAIRDEIARSLGHPTRVVTSVSGYSSVFSDEVAIDAIMMAYAGLRNKRIVEQLQQQGVNAVGLSGIDGRAIQGRRNKGIRVREGGKTLIVRDFSGKPRGVNGELLRLLLDHDYVPVLSIPIADENHTAINSDNDDIVNVLQQTFHAETILQLIEAPGFLEDKNDERSIVPRIRVKELEAREMQVQGRMKRKMLALKKLFEDGASQVILSDGRVEHPVRDALSGKGTVIQ